MSALKRKYLTFTDGLIIVGIVCVFAGILMPAIMERVRYIRWLGFNASMNSDPYTVLNYNFEDPSFKAAARNEETPALRNGAIGSDAPGFNPSDYHGILKNGAEWRRNGRWSFKYALQLDGRDDYIEVPGLNSLDFDPSKDDFSVEMWVALDTVSYPAQTFFSKTSWPDSSQYDLYYVRERFEADVGSSTAAWLSPRINPERWTNIVFTSEGGRFKLYIDGELAADRTKADTFPFPASKSGAKLLIGAAGFRNGYAGHFLHGRIDEVMVLRKALSPTEIRKMYWMGTPY